MSCKQVNLNSANCLNVNSGYDYVFNAKPKKGKLDLTGATIHFKIKSVNDAGFLLQLTNTTDDTISGVFINDLSKFDFDIRIIASDSASIFGNKVFECYYEKATSKQLLFQGQIEFDKGVI